MTNIPTRECKYCHNFYDESGFNKANTVKGVVYKRQKCKKCFHKDRKLRLVKLRVYLKQIKSKLFCKMCGISDYRVLDFHHRGDDKLFNVADMPNNGHSIAAIQLEIAKCDVLCANCHRITHYEIETDES